MFGESQSCDVVFGHTKFELVGVGGGGVVGGAFVGFGMISLFQSRAAILL